MKPFSQQTHYEVLDLNPGATAEQTAEAYRRAKEYFGPGSVAVYTLADAGQTRELLECVEEAYRVLSDPAARAEYDRLLAARQGASPPRELKPVVVEPQRLESPGEAPASPAEPAQPSVSEIRIPGWREAMEASAAAAAQASAAQAEALSSERPPSRTVTPRPASAVADASVQAPAVQAASEGTGQSDAAEAPAPAPEDAPPVARTLTPRPGPAGAAGEPPRKPVDVGPDSVVNGELLRSIREARGLTLRALSDRTKIGFTHLENIEADRYQSLPATVYLRGFLTSIARELRLDPFRVSKGYLAAAGRLRGEHQS